MASLFAAGPGRHGGGASHPVPRPAIYLQAGVKYVRAPIVQASVPGPLDKLFITEEALLLDAYRLGVRVFDSGFRPSFIVGLWRGGSAVGIAVQECLQHLGVATDHIALRTSYRGMQRYQRMVDDASAGIRVHGTQYLLENMNAGDGLLIVDDVYSTGLNVEAVIDRLAKRARRNMPHDVRIAVPWVKPARNRTGRVPDYHLHETDRWLVQPYELNGLTLDEIRVHKPFLAPLIARLRGSVTRRESPAPTAPPGHAPAP